MRTAEEIRKRIGERLAQAARDVARADELTAQAKTMSFVCAEEMRRAQSAEKTTAAVNVTLALEVERLKAIVLKYSPTPWIGDERLKER